MIVNEDTLFSIDKSVDHPECSECGGKGTISLSCAADASGTPIFHEHYCGSPGCYFGKILTPYELTMQKAIYATHNQARTAEVKLACLQWTIDQIETQPRIARLYLLFKKTLPRIEHWELSLFGKRAKVH